MDFNDPRIDLLDKAISQCLVKPKGIMVSPDFFYLLQQSGRLSEEWSALTNTHIFRVDNEFVVTKVDLPEHEPFRIPPEY